MSANIWFIVVRD
jgi:signal transduction histidine kinase